MLATLVFILPLSSTVYAEDEDEEVDTSGNLSDLLVEDDPFFNMIVDVFGFLIDYEYEPFEHMDYPDEPDVSESGGVELEIEKYPINRYVVNNEDSGIINGFMGSVNNGLMSINHLIVRITDTAFAELFRLELLDNVADDIQTVTDDIYETLKDYFAEFLFVFFCGYLIYLFVSKGSGQELLKRSLIFVLVLVVGGYWILNSGFLLKSLNALSNEGQGYLVQAGNGLLDFFGEKKGVYADIDNINEDELLEGTISVMRNVYFDLALKRPYMMINYGETEESVINSRDNIGELGFGFQEFNRVDRMLAFKPSIEGEGYRLSHSRLEVIHNGNENIASGGTFTQFGLVVVTLITTILISIPFSLLAVLNFVLQLLALAIAFVVPFAFIISYIPQLAMTGFKTLGKLGSVFVLKAVLGVFILFLYLLAFTVNHIIEPNSTGMYFLNVIVLAVLMFYMMIKRNAIIAFMTAGYVASLDKNILSNVGNGLNQAKNDFQGYGSNLKNTLSPTKKPKKPLESANEEEQSSKGNPSKTTPKNVGDDTQKTTMRTPQVPKENSRLARHKKANPMERTKQLFSRNKRKSANTHTTNPLNKKNKLTKSNDGLDVKKARKVHLNKGTLPLNRTNKVGKRKQALHLNEAKKQKQRSKLPYGSYDVGEGKSIDSKQKFKPTRNKRNLDVNKAQKVDVSKQERMQARQNIQGKENMNLKGVPKGKKINVGNDHVTSEYNRERHTEISSVEEKKKNRNIDNGLS